MTAAGRLALCYILSGSAIRLVASDLTAFEAFKLVPSPHADNLARIEGREGRPAPDRWRFLVHDPASPTAVREIVVESGIVVASRTLSQFAGPAARGAVVDPSGLSIDSAAAADQLAKHSEANAMAIEHLGYTLARDEETGQPVWTVRGFDADGTLLGAIRIDAGDGALLSRDGFEIAPTPTPTAKPAPREKRARPTPRRKATPRPTPRETEGSVGRTFRKMGNSIERFFGGGDNEREERRR